MVRTGTSGGADNDLDLSFLGPQSAHNRAQTRAYLATRLGVEPDQLKELLHCDFFVDPRRLHAYDALPADLRRAVADEQVAFEQELVLNRALHEAGERGDEAGAMMLRERMSYLGIAEDYVPLDPGDIDDLYRLVDEWSEELVFQGRSASPELVRKIGRAQSQINAVEEGGYLTGGGTRRIVTDRDLAPLLGKAPVEAVDAEAISAALDELLKVYPLIGRIEDALDAGGLVDVIKALDKHVDRFAGATSPAVWDKKALDALFETKSAVWDELWPRIAKFEEMSATAARQLAEARGTARIKLIDRLNTQKAVVIAEARRTVETLLEIQWRLIDDLRGRCNLEGALGNTGLLVAGQDLVRAELRMRRLEDRILGRLADLPSMKWVDVAGLFSTARFLPQDHDPPTGESAGPGSGCSAILVTLGSTAAGTGAGWSPKDLDASSTTSKSTICSRCGGRGNARPGRRRCPDHGPRGRWRPTVSPACCRQADRLGVEEEDPMPQYLSPGVYVEEVESGSRPIEGVGHGGGRLRRRSPRRARSTPRRWSPTGRSSPGRSASSSRAPTSPTPSTATS